jgi:hypothetical protein
MSICLPVAVFPLTFWLQVKLGYEVSLFPLYMLPIAALSWRFGGAGGFLSVLLATVLWYLGNVLTGYEYNASWARYYNTGVRGILFAAVSVFIILFKRVVEQHRRRMEAMRSLLNVCHGCGSLQGSDGSWIPFNQLVVPKVRPLCECPECTRVAQGDSKAKSYQLRAVSDTPKGERRRSEGRRVEDGAEPSKPWKPGDPDRRQHIRREEDR